MGAEDNKAWILGNKKFQEIYAKEKSKALDEAAEKALAETNEFCENEPTIKNEFECKFGAKNARINYT